MTCTAGAVAPSPAADAAPYRAEDSGNRRPRVGSFTDMHDSELPDDVALVSCPYCGESVELLLDPGSGGRQSYVEDCEVCCQPWLVRVRYDRRGRARVEVDAADGR